MSPAHKRSLDRTLAAIVAIAIVEIVALLTGHNGQFFGLCIAALAGLGGFSLAKLLTKDTPPPPPGDFLNR